MRNVLCCTAAVLLLTACASTPEGGGTTASTMASANLSPASGSKVTGRINFVQVGANRVRVTGEVTGHQSGMRGFHIHEKGDCSAPDAMSAGGHFNPHSAKHGPTPAVGHVGDLGNLTFSDAGRATVDVTYEGLTLDRNAPNGIIGRAVVVHAGTDDLKADPTGNAGGRVACGVIS